MVRRKSVKVGCSPWDLFPAGGGTCPPSWVPLLPGSHWIMLPKRLTSNSGANRGLLFLGGRCMSWLCALAVTHFVTLYMYVSHHRGPSSTCFREHTQNLGSFKTSRPQWWYVDASKSYYYWMLVGGSCRGVGKFHALPRLCFVRVYIWHPSPTTRQKMQRSEISETNRRAPASWWHVEISRETRDWAEKCEDRATTTSQHTSEEFVTVTTTDLK